MLTIGSLFSGIGGLEFGLERALGARTIWQVEQDPFCLRVLAKHWPDAKRYTDVCTAKSLPAVDVMCGGFPCQDISVAGKGAALGGARSGLWSEFARLIDEVGPRAVVIENSPALARRGLDKVIRDLADLGFMGSWDVVSAGQLGAPHQRRRLFVVAAHPDRVGVRLDEQWDTRWRDAVRDSGQSVAMDDGKEWRFAKWNGGAPASEVRRMDAGLFSWMDGPGKRRHLDGARFKALGNAVVPQVAELVGRVVAEVLK